MIPVIWHKGDNYWDTAMPRWILEKAADCAFSVGLETAQPAEVGVIVIPGRHSCGDYEVLNEAAKNFVRVVWVIIGDEEGIFHSDQLRRQRSRIWWFMPPFNPQQRIDRVGPNGWPTTLPGILRQPLEPERLFEWSFMGQMTHSRRIECVNATQRLIASRPDAAYSLLTTDGFTQGVPPLEYFGVMKNSKLVLCPSGPCTPDSFRFAEALELGCIPIVDELTQNPKYPPGYWNYLFGSELPFPLVQNWNLLPMIAELYLHGWESRSRKCQEWWSKQKLRLVREMKEDLCLI